MKCPKCGKDLGEPTEVDLNTIGWSYYPECKIKIYQSIDIGK